MTRAAHPSPTERGFTLIEILLATLIFLSGVTGVYALLSTGLAMQQDGMELARLNRRLDQVVHRLELELSEGLHFDVAADAWVDVEAALLPDGTFYRVAFVPEVGAHADHEAAGTLLAHIRVASTEKGLELARPVSYVLTPGPTQPAAVRGWRARNPVHP